MSENNLLSIEEQEELKAAIAEAEAEGNDDAPEVEAKPDDKPAEQKPEAKAEAKADEKVEADDDPLPQLEEATPAKRDERIQLLVADDTAEAEKEIDQIKAYRTKLHDQFSAGELDQKEYAKKLDEAQDRMTELTALLRNAETAAKTNMTNMRNLWLNTAEDYRSQYTELKSESAVAALDHHCQRLREGPKIAQLVADGASPTKVFKYVLKEAHKKVREDFGMVGNKPNEVRESAPGPKTLAGLPSAVPSSTGSDEFSDIDNMTGVEAEKALARMTPDKKERYLTRIGA